MSLRRAAEALRGWARDPRLPLRTVRMRLTLLYGALFLISGAVLLAVAYTLTWNATKPPVDGTVRTGDVPDAAGPKSRVGQLKRDAIISQHATVMHQLLASCAIALAITAVLSIVLGWLVAGRVLRPLRTMTAATQRISGENLHERLAVTGPPDELKRLGDTIDDLLARLEEAFGAQRRFVANASHELRTPLTMMRTAVDVATRKPSPEPGVAILAGKIRAGLDRADRLVENFLTLARAQHGGATQTMVALGRLAAAVVAEHSAAISGRHLTLDQDLHDAPVPGSEALLTHLIGNLIDNAIRHNQPGGWIRVATGADPETGTARLTVENSGPVLDPGRVGELAEPFRRAAADRTGDDAGAGLGLSIVAAIVATHHGRLDLHPRPGGGLRVSVILPLAGRQALTAAATA